ADGALRARGRAPRRGSSRDARRGARGGAGGLRGVSGGRAALALACLLLPSCAALRLRPRGPLVPAAPPPLAGAPAAGSLPAALDVACTCRSVSGRLEGGTVRPYPSRAEIDAGALAGRGLEVAWAADPIALLVLHVQGSGLLRLDDGRVLGIRYAGTN